MKKMVRTLLSVLAIALVLGMVSGTALAQDNSTYAVTYFSNANIAGAPDGTVRVINDGNTGGSLCAAFYVFDDSQEMQECCSCPVTADGLIAESINGNLLANSLTSFVNHRGVIKVVSTNVPSGGCDPTKGSPTTGIRGWATHIQAAFTPVLRGSVISSWAVTEDPLHDANLAASELAGLQQFCSFEIVLGSGRGVCSCGLEDHAF
jgi:hypothetical protein